MKYIFFNFLFDIKRNLRAECDNEHLMQTQKRLKVHVYSQLTFVN